MLGRTIIGVFLFYLLFAFPFSISLSYADSVNGSLLFDKFTAKFEFTQEGPEAPLKAEEEPEQEIEVEEEVADEKILEEALKNKKAKPTIK